MLLRHPDEIVRLIAVAAIGNTAGSMVNYAVGFWLGNAVAARATRIVASKQRVDEAIEWFRRYGKWSLLFAWLPIIGDPLTVAAGVLRISLIDFIVLVAIGKIARYVFVAVGLQMAGSLWGLPL